MHVLLSCLQACYPLMPCNAECVFCVCLPQLLPAYEEVLKPPPLASTGFASLVYGMVPSIAL